jgi:hypothetical protein
MEIVEVLGRLADLTVAHAAFAAAVVKYPRKRTFLCERAKDALHVCKSHLDLLALATRLQEGLRIGQVRVVLAAWKDDYNMVRPHSALGNLTPAEYVDRSAPRPQRDGALRYTGGFAPHPAAPPSPTGSMKLGLSSSADESWGSGQTDRAQSARSQC